MISKYRRPSATFNYMQWNGESKDSIRKKLPGAVVFDRPVIYCEVGRHKNIALIEQGDYIVKSDDGYFSHYTKEAFDKSFIIENENIAVRKACVVSVLSWSNDFNELFQLTKSFGVTKGKLFLETVTGTVKVNVGNMIVEGLGGELYVYSIDDFIKQNMRTVCDY